MFSSEELTVRLFLARGELLARFPLRTLESFPEQRLPIEQIAAICIRSNSLEMCTREAWPLIESSFILCPRTPFLRTSVFSTRHSRLSHVNTALSVDWCLFISVRWCYWRAPCCGWTQRENTRAVMANYFSFSGKVYRIRYRATIPEDNIGRIKNAPIFSPVHNGKIVMQCSVKYRRYLKRSFWKCFQKWIVLPPSAKRKDSI